jgi:heterodisulfide reductase subunit A
VEFGRHENIEILTLSEIEGITGEQGNFQVTIKQRPRYIDMERCIACGTCAEKCPRKVPDEYHAGLKQRKAAYIPYPQAVPLKYLIDADHCIYFEKGKCRACEKFCPAGAIDFSQTEREITIAVGAIILAPGFETFDATIIHEYGYNRFPNVINSLEFERMLSSSGPFAGRIQRLSDGKPPEKIAFIQCVGSRDLTYGKGYCSSVCCTYAIKEAIVAKEHSSLPLETTIFMMDLRTYGKDFDRYCIRARDEHQVRFVRSKVYGVEQVHGNGDLRIRFTREDGEVATEPFDLVVLSLGFQPPPSAITVGKRLGIHLNRYRFCATCPFRPLETSRPGIFACGAFSGPKDIPETVMQASGAAGAVSALLAPVRGTLTTVKEYPEERDVSGEEPRIGVFVCHCGINIGGIVDVPEVKEFAERLDNVVYAEDNLYTCSQDSQERIKQKIAEHHLNRVVVASCSPRTHESTFQETLRDAGLNPYLFEMANIRDQCSWVHAREPEKATEKAKDLVRMAVAKARLLKPLPQMALDLTHTALVIGGGIAGMEGALNLAEQGFEVHLIEKSGQLGGMARRIHYTLEGGDVQAYLADLVDKVSTHPLIRVYTGAHIVDVAGFIGNFTTGVMVERKRYIHEIRHGVTLIATGGKEYRPTEYLYGTDPRVLTQLELEEEIVKANPEVVGCSDLVMIQCVGSRNTERPYCSRVCCSQAVKNALKLKAHNPAMNIYILYRDIRTYGFKEDYYREARARGIVFIRYEEDHPPTVETVRRDRDYVLTVRVRDPILDEELLIDTDILALSVAVVPSPEIGELAQFYKIPVNEDGFFLEAHAKLRPVDFATDGVFMAGLHPVQPLCW